VFFRGFICPLWQVVCISGGNPYIIGSCIRLYF
jgi:hypothetical protein